MRVKSCGSVQPLASFWANAEAAETTVKKTTRTAERTDGYSWDDGMRIIVTNPQMAFRCYTRLALALMKDRTAITM